MERKQKPRKKKSTARRDLKNLFQGFQLGSSLGRLYMLEADC